MSPKVQSCTFCAIRDGAIEAVVVLDEPETLAFLDHRPLFAGHVLLVPRIHHANIFDLPHALGEPLFAATQRLAGAVRTAMAADGVFIASNNGISQSVDHFHIHVVPRRKKDGLRGFMWPRQRYSDPQDMRRIGAEIRASLE